MRSLVVGEKCGPIRAGAWWSFEKVIGISHRRSGWSVASFGMVVSAPILSRLLRVLVAGMFVRASFRSREVPSVNSVCLMMVKVRVRDSRPPEGLLRRLTSSRFGLSGLPRAVRFAVRPGCRRLAFRWFSGVARFRVGRVAAGMVCQVVPGRSAYRGFDGIVIRRWG